MTFHRLTRVIKLPGFKHRLAGRAFLTGLMTIALFGCAGHRPPANDRSSTSPAGTEGQWIAAADFA